MPRKIIAALVVALMAAAPANAGVHAVAKSLHGGASAPTCLAGWQTQQQASWLLVCRIIVAPQLKALTIAAANNANCQVNSYWNFGPKVKILQDKRRFVELTYTCGHVEG